MTQRKLKRKLNLLQLIMLGTAGTIAAEIFVLTGYAAGLVGPAAVLALIIAGLMSYAIAFDYCELATMYPVTGGGVTYVREAWGTNLLTFLVGSLDCLSSTFYAALSAVGFAWSLKVFIPTLPVVPTALVTILVFIVLNILDVSNIGNIQIVLGTILLACLGIFIVAGFVAPNGFSWATFTEGDFFIHQGVAANTAKILNTVALVYCAYIGYEVIAHDAEEAENPSRNLPTAILVSLTICALVYVLIALVTLGTVPWQQVAGSETALTDVVGNFLPKYGVPMMAVAGMIATLTSVNAALLSGTREAFTLGRSGLWPRSMSRLSRFRTPYIACWFIGAITCLVASVGMVDFLSYVSSAGLLFVLFFSNLAMIRLRKLRPNAERPFKAKLFPLTPVLAILSCFLVVSFSSWQALLFTGLVLAVCTVFYYTYKPLSRVWAERAKAHESARDRILVPVASPATAQGLARLAFVLAEASEDTSICILTINSSVTALSSAIRGRIAGQLNPRRRVVLQQITDEARIRNAALYTKVSNSSTVAQGILDEVGGNVKLVLMGWPGPLTPQQLPDHPVKLVLQKAHAHVAVLLNRGLDNVQRILVPVGGGFHSRLALRLAYEIGFPQHAQITAVHIVCQPCDSEELEDHMLNLREIIEESLGQMPPDITTRLVYANDVLSGVLQEAQRLPYDLIVIGASEEWLSRTQLFGALTDEIAEKTTCSVLLARRYESAAMAWLKSRSRMLTGAASNTAAPAHNGGR
ncbi:MAG: amino acid permease [Chloroflexi bacterium]|nr:amino acid permease [Chloroflexota bacterium]